MEPDGRPSKAEAARRIEDLLAGWGGLDVPVPSQALTTWRPVQLLAPPPRSALRSEQRSSRRTARGGVLVQAKMEDVMSKVSGAMSAVTTAMACSVALVFIASVVIGAVALAVGTTVTVPWVLSATAGTANGAASLSLVPNGTGIAVVVLVLAAAGIVRSRTSRRSVPGPAARRPGGVGVR